ncbi:hypothetical protein [Salinicola tamaricis]|uniref:hypothetical protein n=1 Tax=Salinicola tamaricis TaxID=1771309 RepID=UPI003BF5E25F
MSAERLRFDFSHFEPVTPNQLAEITRIVNAEILANAPTHTEQMTLDQAKAKGAQALFEAKYADSVRVLTIGSDGFSIELCGGTHVARTGDIGPFHIVAESGTAAGVRRIEAVTGEGALAWFDAQRQLNAVGERLKARPEQVVERLDSVLERQRTLEKELERLKAKVAARPATSCSMPCARSPACAYSPLASKESGARSCAACTTSSTETGLRRTGARRRAGRQGQPYRRGHR